MATFVSRILTYCARLQAPGHLLGLLDFGSESTPTTHMARVPVTALTSPGGVEATDN